MIDPALLEPLQRAGQDEERLLVLIGWHFPDLRLAEHVGRWSVLDGSPVLAVDGDVLFELDGEDLLVTGSVPGGRIHVYRLTPDRRAQLIAAAPDPFAPSQARLN